MMSARYTLLRILILLLFAGSTAVGQIKVVFEDERTAAGIEGIVVMAAGAVQGQQFSGITDRRGTIELPQFTLPIQLEVSHVSYEGQTIEITSYQERKVQLQQSLTSLDPVVITGQHEAQSINQSVFTVKSIDAKRIEDQGAVDLADVLSNNLNITLTPNKSDGRTGISMLGLDGQYVKILIDGIPFVGVDGNGNNADITQINMNAIERIEIVEGPMAVSYGANAMAGVINLITKKSATKSILIQEETVGSEYGLDRGRHIQSFNVGHYLHDNLLARVDFRRNDFRGLQGIFEGEDHTESDNLRGYDWHPKIQYMGSASLNYRKDGFEASYTHSNFWQRLTRYSATVDPMIHQATGIANPLALDNEVTTKRFVHQLNLSGSLGSVNYTILSAYNSVELTDETFQRFLLSDARGVTTNTQTAFMKSFTSRGNFTNLLNSDQFSLEAGYEFTGEGIRGEQINGGDRGIDNMALFSSLEWSVSERLKIRPGLRTMYNSSYSAPIIYSMNMRYSAADNVDIRASFGRSYRTPNLTELYFYFVDANHNVQGNPNLVPEDGYGASVDIKRRSKIGNGWYTGSVKLFYNDLSDQITLANVAGENEGSQRFLYINVDRFKSQGFTFANNFNFRNFNVNAGVSYIGRYNRFNEEEEGLETFLYSPEININSTYRWTKHNLQFAVFYKLTGAVDQYVLNEDNEFEKGRVSSFNWLDLTTTWNATRRIQLAGGVKNIMNISDVNTSAGTAGAHSDAPTSVGLTYGRSYFMRIGYTFN